MDGKNKYYLLDPGRLYESGDLVQLYYITGARLINIF